MELNKYEISYLIISFLFSLSLSCILILIKVDCKNATCISTILALFFLIFYFYQPFLLCIDRLKSYIIYYSLEKPNFDIEYFLDWEYNIIGWVGLGFSNFILPFHRNYIFSGYLDKGDRIKDSFKRWIKEKYGDLIIVLVDLLVSYIIEKEKHKKNKLEEFSFELANYILNAFQIPEVFNALWYLGSFFPLLFGQMRIENECCCNSKKYNDQYKNNIKESLNKDQKKLEENYSDMLFICKKFIDDVKKKEELNKFMNIVENNKGKFKLELINEKELKEKQKKYEKEITLDNFKDKLASAFRSMKKRIYKLPKKFYEYQLLDKKSKQYNNQCNVIYSGLMLLFGALIFVFEISLYYVEYKSIRNPLEFEKDFIYSLVISLIYFSVVYYSVVTTNCLTKQNLYGIRQSDSLCLLKFTESISGLIEPLSFLFIGTKALGIFNLRDNLTFMETYDIPIIEAIFIGLKFKDIYNIYIHLRLFILALALGLTFKIDKITIKSCCKGDSYLIKTTINDMNSTKKPEENEGN